MDDRIADRIRHLTGIGVDTFELALRRVQLVSILVADVCLGHIRVPIAFFLSLHRMFASVPVIERPDHRYTLRMRRPYPKLNPLSMRGRSQRPDCWVTIHGSFPVGIGYPKSQPHQKLPLLQDLQPVRFGRDYVADDSW